jgi:hypothetical protein
MRMNEVRFCINLYLNLLGRVYGIESLVKYSAEKAAYLAETFRDTDSVYFLVIIECITDFRI